ncbi:hypothetical protein ACOSQ4_018445 [Xanthoceras sorbifolium]
MNCLSHMTSYSSAFLRRTHYIIARSSLHQSYTPPSNTKFGYLGVKTIDLEFLLTRFRVQCYSFRSSSAKKNPEQDKNEFFVVRKGDVVGVYKSLAECQAQVGSSVCHPLVSVYEGHSLPKDTEEYLISHGLKNALYTIRAVDLIGDHFGSLMPCPFQKKKREEEERKEKKKKKKRKKGVAIGSASISTDHVTKHIKLDQEVQVAFADSICKLREGVSIATNNVSDYRALILGLKYAIEKGYTKINAQGDSKLICMLVSGSWKARHPHMFDLCTEAKKSMDKFLLFQITHVLRQIQQTHLSLPRRDNGMLSSLCALALNNKSKKNDTTLRESDGSDFDDDDDGEQEEEEEDDNDKEGMFLPFEEMKRWLENKPRGFGEGKVYDTSIKEKLLEEIEQSREAHIANINKCKNDSVKTSPKKEDGKIKASEGVPSGFRVHLANLPKKKNIHRDLESAFEGVPSIINISPAISGNKKTKDPICKGFAFVDFKSEEDATRFTQIFSKQSISFDSAYNNVELTTPGLEEEPDADSNVDYDTSDSWMEAAFDGSDPDGELDLAKMEDIRENLEIVSVSELNGKDNKKQDKKSSRDSSSSNQRKKIQAIKKKQIAKGDVKKKGWPVDRKWVKTTKGMLLSTMKIVESLSLLPSARPLLARPLVDLTRSPLAGVFVFLAAQITAVAESDRQPLRTLSPVAAASSSSLSHLAIASEGQLTHCSLSRCRWSRRHPHRTLSLNPIVILFAPCRRFPPRRSRVNFDRNQFLFLESKQSGENHIVMNCLSHMTSYSTAILRRTRYIIARSSLHQSYTPPSNTKFGHLGVKTIDLEFLLTRFRVQCYSSRSSSAKKTRSHKVKAKPEMEQDKNEFFVVRKGDVVGVYKSLAECQAQVGSSVCHPPVSVYKGHSLPKDTEEYLISHGLKNALYTIRAADLTEDLFGSLMPCPFQDPTSKKRSQDIIDPEIGEAIGSASISTDHVTKHIKLDHEVQVTSADSYSCFIQFDGASKGNPGPAGAGAVLRTGDGNLICKLREGVGIATNNVAEYRALILGLKYALEKGYTKIDAQGDSKLVCMQVSGSWKARHPHMFDLCTEAKKLMDKFLSFRITHVLRNLNSDADAQANLAIDLANGEIAEEFEN